VKRLPIARIAARTGIAAFAITTTLALTACDAQTSQALLNTSEALSYMGRPTYGPPPSLGATAAVASQAFSQGYAGQPWQPPATTVQGPVQATINTANGPVPIELYPDGNGVAHFPNGDAPFYMQNGHGWIMQPSGLVVGF
jgi:hypothetical protein